MYCICFLKKLVSVWSDHDDTESGASPDRPKRIIWLEQTEYLFPRKSAFANCIFVCYLDTIIFSEIRGST